MGRTALGATAIWLLLCAVAAAQEPLVDRPLNDTRTTESLRLAYRFWDATPACHPSVYLTASIVTPEGVAAHAYATPSTCTIRVTPSLYRETRRMGDMKQQERVAYCAVITHEVGHLLGRPHSTRHRSIMFSGRATAYPPRLCVARFAPWLFAVSPPGAFARPAASS